MDVPNPQILIIDDDPIHGDSVRALLTAHDYEADFTKDSREGLELLRRRNYQVLVLDLNMPGASGMDILEDLSAREAEVKTIVLSGESTLASVTPILRLGAYDFLQKPFEPQQLVTSVANALNYFRLERRNRTMSAEAEASHELHEFLVNSTPDMIYMLDEQGNFSFINNQLHSLFNAEPKELLGHSWEKLLGDRLVQRQVQLKVLVRWRVLLSGR